MLNVEWWMVNDEWLMVNGEWLMVNGESASHGERSYASVKAALQRLKQLRCGIPSGWSLVLAQRPQRTRRFQCRWVENANDSQRIRLDFTANVFNVMLFCLFEPLFGIFALFVLANRPLFAVPKQSKSTQKHLSTKLEIKSKQTLTIMIKCRTNCHTPPF